MPDYLFDRADRVPDGTDVYLYPTTNWPVPGQPSGAPLGTETTSDTMTDGSVTLTANPGEYWVYADVGGHHLYFGAAISAVVSDSEAADIAFTPAGTIAATDVQAAIEEAASEAGGSQDAADILEIFNVKDFGATGDSTTDDASAIQDAIDACDANRGGTVYFPQGRYRIATGLTVDNQGTWLVGEGSPGVNRATAQGSTRIISDDGVTAITFNAGSSTFRTLGYGMKNLHVLGASGATTGNGVLVRTTQKFTVYDVTCSDYTGGYGMKIGHVGTNSQYSELHNFSAGTCATGLWLGSTNTAPNGCRIWGGYFEGNGISTTPVASSIGIKVDAGDTLRLYGTVLQGWETAVYITSAAADHELHGPRFEYCNTSLRTASRNTMLLGGSFANSLLGGAGTPVLSSIAVRLDAGANNCTIMPSEWLAADGSGGSNLVVDPTVTGLRLPASAGEASASFVLGNVVAKQKVTDPITGAALGYTPIYDSITGITGPTLVKASNPGTTSVSSVTLTVPGSGVAAGEHLWVLVGYGLASTPASLTVTDSKSNTYTLEQQNDLTTGDTPHTAVYTCKVATALVGGDTITWTPSTAVNYPQVYAYKSGGAKTSSWTDDKDGATGTGTAAASPSLTTAEAWELVIGIVCCSSTQTIAPDSGYTQLGTETSTAKRTMTFYKIGTASGSETPSVTLSGSSGWAISAVGVKKA